MTAIVSDARLVPTTKNDTCHEMQFKSILKKATKTCLKSCRCLPLTREQKLGLQSNFTFAQLIRDKFSMGIN